MKKIICLLMAVMLIVGCTFSASATEFNAYNQNVGSGEIAVTSHLYSHFDISIPETLDTSVGGEVAITNASIEDGYAIKVSVSNFNNRHCIEMTHKTQPNVTAEMTLRGNWGFNKEPDVIVKFTDDDIQNGSATSPLNANIDSRAVAGEYEGTVSYFIDCSEDIPIT